MTDARITGLIAAMEGAVPDISRGDMTQACCTILVGIIVSTPGGHQKHLEALDAIQGLIDAMVEDE
jgi:hypothetical protein